jgi:dTDP-4-amino-4,6-dideoxygalactose transaminase
MNIDGLFPTADKLAQCSVSLPIYPELLDSEIEHVVKTIQEYYD